MRLSRDDESYGDSVSIETQRTILRKYAADKYGPERHKIVTLINSFHGRTIATLTATGQEEMHRDFKPLLPGFLYTPANDCEALKALVAEHDDIAAIMFELVQGEGGVMPLERAFVDCMAELAAEKDILLVCDEVQTGNGRTGSLYAWMQYDFFQDRGLLDANDRHAVEVLDREKSKNGWVGAQRDNYAKLMHPAVREAREREQELLIDQIYRINKPVVRKVELRKL